jgi:hypothetical protein
MPEAQWWISTLSHPKVISGFAHAADPCFFFPVFWAGNGLKRFLEAVGFILAEFEPKPSHVDPISV